jgi:ectoine hydroxylase-related dioxygenase (phytanoyl-CoA dioxygenase family)
MPVASAGSDSGYEVTAQDVAEYWERGYWISPKLIDDPTIERVRRAMGRLFDGKIDGDGWYFEGQFQPPSDPLALRRVINAWWVNDESRDLVMNPMVGRIAASLMRVDGVRLWSDQALIKPGSGPEADTTAGNIGWHQDKSYWHISSTDNMVTAWIALQDTDLSNGGMRTLVGSHQWDLVPGSDKFYEKDLGKLREEFSGRVKSWTDEPCILRAGQASFHHSLCFHASETNKTHAPRLSVVGHYIPDGTLFQSSGRYTINLRALGPRPRSGQPFADPAFPLVWQRQTT